jgi:hypothetical protein
MMFEEDNQVERIWEIIKKDRDALRGNHEALKHLFADKDAPYFAVAGNKEYVVTRNVHNIKGEKRVIFQIFTRLSYFQAEKNYVKAMLDKVNE